MHPDILRELTAQHGRDLRERAHRAHVARTLRGLRRSRRPSEADEIAVPAIPDFVDGSFRVGPAGDETASQVPAARHAA
jgi:hypothetical protein